MAKCEKEGDKMLKTKCILLNRSHIKFSEYWTGEISFEYNFANFDK